MPKLFGDTWFADRRLRSWDDGLPISVVVRLSAFYFNISALIAW